MATDGKSSCAREDLRVALGDLEGSTGSRSAYARQQAGLWAFGRRTSVQPPLSILIQDAAALIAEVLQMDLHGVAKLMGGQDGISLTLSSTDERGNATQCIAQKLGVDRAASAAAFALSGRDLVATPNLATETRYSDPFLSGLGVSAVVSMPLYVDGKPFASLAVCHTSPREFPAEDARFVETIAHILTPSIARSKAEEEVGRYRAVAASVLDMIESLAVTLDASGNVLDMNSACIERSGFALDEVRGHAIWNALIDPAESKTVREFLKRCRFQGAPVNFECWVMTKSGDRRRIAWTLKQMPASGPSGRSFVLLGSEARESAPAPDAESGHPFRRMETKGRNESRRSPRREFQCSQRIAPVYAGVLPSRNKFREVPCKDISASGIAFYLDHAPDFDTLVVALGKPPTESHLTARVMRVVEQPQRDHSRYLVGCRFIGRVIL